ncbi:hypothetical protein GQ600_19259 [Phytophthora cactorum]|nr:hypothetical protein GQ600_19259 [Phytophthora cactorum]
MGTKTPSSRRTIGPDATWCKKMAQDWNRREPSDCASAASQLRHCEPVQVSSMARQALVEWLKLRKEYEEYTQDRGKEGKEDVSAVMKSVKSFFDASVLETLCEVCWGVDQSSSNIRILYELVRVKAKEQAIELRPMKKANPSNSKHSRKEQKTAEREEEKEEKEDQNQQKGGRSGRAAAKGAPKDGCFHCGGAHTCPNAPRQRQSSGTSYSRTAKKTTKKTQATKGGTAKLKRIGEFFPNGADRCCLDESRLDRLVHVRPEIVRVKLD